MSSYVNEPFTDSRAWRIKSTTLHAISTQGKYFPSIEGEDSTFPRRRTIL